MAASTFWRVVSLMYRGPLTTFDTVRYETPANAATSLIVGAPLRLAGLRSSGLFTPKSYLAMLQRCDIFLFPRCNIRSDLLECSCGTPVTTRTSAIVHSHSGRRHVGVDAAHHRSEAFFALRRPRTSNQ